MSKPYDFRPSSDAPNAKGMSMYSRSFLYTHYTMSIDSLGGAQIVKSNKLQDHSETGNGESTDT